MFYGWDHYGSSRHGSLFGGKESLPSPVPSFIYLMTGMDEAYLESASLWFDGPK
jgi:hypothetical protein